MSCPIASNAPMSLLLQCLIYGSLLIRAVIPAGWMPVSAADGFRIEICSASMSPTEHAAFKASAQQMLQAAMPQQGGHDDPAPKPNDQHCPFSVLGHAFLGSFTPPAEVMIQDIRLAAVLPGLVSVGHGLAAPPPPSTGPPSLS